MLLPCLVQVTESISGSVVPLAMFEKVYKLRPYPTLQIAIETQITDGNIGDVYPTSTSKLCEFIRFSVIDGGFALEISHVLCVSSHFWPFTKKWFPTSYLAETKMFQQKNNPKVVCNMYNRVPFLVSHFSFLLLPTGSPLMKLWQF